MIRIDQLRVEFGKLVAVDGLSPETKPGQIFGFLGPNGAEKTTTVRVLTGVLGQLELSEAANPAVSRYSKGMCKKLLIAREVLHRPKVLFCGEPTANLDAHSTIGSRR